MSKPAPALERSLAASLGVLDPEEEAPALSGSAAELAQAALACLEVGRDEVPSGSWEALAERIAAEDEDPARPRPKVTLTCTYCHDGLVRRAAVYCATCLAPHHEACFAEHGRCSVLGCGETQVVRAGALDAPARVEPRRRGVPHWAVAAAASVLLLLVGGYGVYSKIVVRRGPTESVHPDVVRTYVGGSAVLEVEWRSADRPIKPGNIAWEDLSGAPSDSGLLLLDQVAQVDWVLPRLERSLFLVKGLGEGTTEFKIYYPLSNRLVTYRVEVEGDDPHLAARDQRQLELRERSPRELAKLLRDYYLKAKVLSERRELPGQEDAYRQASLYYGYAADAALALAFSEDRRGGRTRTTVDSLGKCKRAELEAQEDWLARIDQEELRYRELLAKKSGTVQLAAQVRILLRLIDDSCDVRFKRYAIVLREAYGSTFEHARCAYDYR